MSDSLGQSSGQRLGQVHVLVTNTPRVLTLVECTGLLTRERNNSLPYTYLQVAKEKPDNVLSFVATAAHNLHKNPPESLQ